MSTVIFLIIVYQGQLVVTEMPSLQACEIVAKSVLSHTKSKKPEWTCLELPR